MDFDYFYGDQSEAFAFYRTPKLFYTDEKFRSLSSDAKILYGIMLDRLSLSVKNDWRDDDGKVYIYMTLDSVEEMMGCARQKAVALVKELADFGLIEKKKQGLCKPTRIYVKNFVRVWKSYSQEFENHTSGSLKITPPDEWKSYSNNTEINYTDINKTNPILSAEAVDKDEDERASYYEYFKEQLCFEALIIDHPYDKDMLEEILELIVDTVCSKRKQIRIAGDDKPVNVVKSSFMKLDKSHIDYVLSCMKESSPDIRNIKQYILAALYNAPMTIGNYYQAMYNNDHANGLI